MSLLRQAGLDRWRAISPATLVRTEIIGPAHRGRREWVQELQRGITTQDVNDLATIASVDAQTPYSRS